MKERLQIKVKWAVPSKYSYLNMSHLSDSSFYEANYVSDIT